MNSTSALRLLALRGLLLATLRVRNRAFAPRVGEKLPRILEISAFIVSKPILPNITVEATFLGKI